MGIKELRSQLGSAIRDTDFPTVKSLLQEHPDVLDQPSGDWSRNAVLHEALFTYRTATNRDMTRPTPPDEEKMRQAIEIFTYLADAGADVNMRDSQGRNPLFYVRDSVELAEILIAAGADVNARDDGQFGAGRTAGYPYLLTPLFFAGSAEVAMALLAAGAEVDARESRGYTPLFETKSAGIAKVLLDAGAEVDAEDNFDRTPLKIQVGSPEVVELLLAAGADPNVALTQALLGCCGRHDHELATLKNHQAYARSVDLLMAAGAEVGFSSAIFLEPLDAIRDRLESNPDLNLQGGIPETYLWRAIMMADREDRGEINAAIVENRYTSQGAQPPFELSDYCVPTDKRPPCQPVDLVKLCLEYGVQPNGDHLHSAVLRGRQGMEIAQVLLEVGVDPNFKDNDGRTLLKVVQQLGKNDGMTPLPNAKEVSALLKKFGGKLRATASSKSAGKSKTAAKSAAASASMLDKLLKIIDPPDDAVKNDAALLQEVVAALGTELPEDFLQFGRTFGSGTIHVQGAGDWEIFSPYSTSYPEMVKDFAEIHGEIREASEIPMDLFPEPFGVLPFARNEGAYLGWQTGGDPDSWMTAQFCSEDTPSTQVHTMGFAELLYQILTLGIGVRGWQDFEKWDPKVDISFSAGSHQI